MAFLRLDAHQDETLGQKAIHILINDVDFDMFSPFRDLALSRSIFVADLANRVHQERVDMRALVFSVMLFMVTFNSDALKKTPQERRLTHPEDRLFCNPVAYGQGKYRGTHHAGEIWNASAALGCDLPTFQRFLGIPMSYHAPSTFIGLYQELDALFADEEKKACNGIR